MDILESLKDDHRKVKAMFEQLADTTPRAHKTRTEVLAKLEADLLVHMQFEEQVFYPELKTSGDAEARELTNEAYAEHEAATATLAKLKQQPTEDEMWKAWLSVLKESVTHHIEEEEEDLFDHAKKAIKPERRKQMAELYDTMKRERSPAPKPQPSPGM